MEMVQYEVSDRIGYITLNRPEKRNALRFELVSELKAVFLEAETDPSAKVIVLRANGNIFCSGADLESLKRLQGFSMEENLSDSRHLSNLFYQIYALKKVVIAQVEGHALAGGCGLVTVCDFAFAVPEARLGYTEVKIGFVPAIVMTFLLRKAGEQIAKQLLLTGDLISAEQARLYHIINQVVPKEDIARAVNDFAAKLVSENSGESLERTKNMIGEIQSMSIQDALEYAAKMNAQARSSDDCKRGVSAFLDKQQINW